MSESSLVTITIESVRVPHLDSLRLPASLTIPRHELHTAMARIYEGLPVDLVAQHVSGEGSRHVRISFEPGPRPGSPHREPEPKAS